MNANAFVTFVLAGLVYAAALDACRAPNAPAPTDAADGAAVVIVQGQRPCADACARLEALGCPEAAATGAGTTCAELCARTQEAGALNLVPECVSAAADVAELRARCGVRCRRP